MALTTNGTIQEPADEGKFDSNRCSLLSARAGDETAARDRLIEAAAAIVDAETGRSRDRANCRNVGGQQQDRQHFSVKRIGCKYLGEKDYDRQMVDESATLRTRWDQDELGRH